ncbi:cytochrome c [Luteimonas aquatica]|uniref:cytochrome c n=1 Tax=Luteimonas aquatica TaxID=450364 RepID=UPI001F56026C|nr:cytochrome c [Luteimonas aquatica]
MSTTPNPAPKSSAFGRYFFLFLIGLVVGAIATVMALRAIEARKDHYPDAVMTVMQAHVGQLKASTEANRCSATDILPHLQALRTMSNDIEPAFGDLREDERFAKHASQLRATLDGALASPPLNCAGAGAAAGKIGEACKACHQDFRG